MVLSSCCTPCCGAGVREFSRQRQRFTSFGTQNKDTPFVKRGEGMLSSKVLTLFFPWKEKKVSLLLLSVEVREQMGAAMLL